MIGRSVLFSGWIFVLWFMLQILPVTRLVYHPIKAEVAGTEVTMFREFPTDALGLPRPTISYEEVIRPLSPLHNGGHSCVQKGGPFQYSRADAVGKWDISWAAACLSDPVGYDWSATWYWHIGSMRMGPVDLHETIITKGTSP